LLDAVFYGARQCPMFGIKPLLGNLGVAGFAGHVLAA
jgi:hypothetical protein